VAIVCSGERKVFSPSKEVSTDTKGKKEGGKINSAGNPGGRKGRKGKGFV